MKQFIYADNAATTKIDDAAFEAMKPYFLEEYGNPSQPYSFGRVANRAINESRKIIASCIGASPKEIYFTSGGTESNNWVIKNPLCYNTIITSCIEHHAILKACETVSNRTEIKTLKVNNQGVIDLNDLDNALKDSSGNRAILVSIMTANNEIGTIQPIAQIADIVHSRGAIFHTDAVQAVGHISIDVDKMGIDMLSASAHKFNGPKGIGFLYIKNGIAINPLIDGGSQENGMRAGTEAVASIVGMAEALKNNIDNLELNTHYVQNLEKCLIEKLESANLDFVRNGSNNRIPGNISVSFKNCDGEMILHRMDLKGICISTGSACDSVNTQVSHVIKSIGLDSVYANGTIRISLGKNNTMEDVDTISSELISIIKN